MGSAARQYPHQDAPNSMTADPAIDSIAARVSTAKLGHWLRPGSFVLPSCFPILVHDYQMMQMIHRMTLPFSLSLCRDHRLPLRGKSAENFRSAKVFQVAVVKLFELPARRSRMLRTTDTVLAEIAARLPETS